MEVGTRELNSKVRPWYPLPFRSVTIKEVQANALPIEEKISELTTNRLAKDLNFFMDGSIWVGRKITLPIICFVATYRDLT
jgi:hypothetical protein